MNFPYTIRNEQGIMIAKLNAKNAGDLINTVEGFWRPRRTKTGVSTVFEIERDFVVMLLGVRFYLWAGYILVREE